MRNVRLTDATCWSLGDVNGHREESKGVLRFAGFILGSAFALHFLANSLGCLCWLFKPRTLCCLPQQISGWWSHACWCILYSAFSSDT